VELPSNFVFLQLIISLQRCIYCWKSQIFWYGIVCPARFITL